jgi:hypothetical protein
MPALFRPGLRMWLPAACERIATVRFVALLLSLACAGPSVSALVCDWTCATELQAAAATEGNCHDTPGPAQTVTFAAGHACHELPTGAASIVTSTPRVVDVPLGVESAMHEIVPLQGPSLVTRRPDRSHAPPPTRIVPLRI